MKKIITVFSLTALAPVYGADTALVDFMKTNLIEYRSVQRKEIIPPKSAEDIQTYKKERITLIQKSKSLMAQLIATLHNPDASVEEVAQALGKLSGYNNTLVLMYSASISGSIQAKPAILSAQAGAEDVSLESIQEAHNRFKHNAPLTQEQFDTHFATVIEDYDKAFDAQYVTQQSFKV